MYQTNCPPVFDQLIKDFEARGARYIELTRADDGFELRALMGTHWKPVPLDEQEAGAIWEWATGKIKDRLSRWHRERQTNHSPPVILAGRFGQPEHDHSHVTCLKFRWRAHPEQRHQDRGTLAMRLSSLAA